MQKEVAGAVGVDRNLRNLTVGNAEKATYYDMAKIVDVASNTRGILSSFKRSDVRVRRRLSLRYGERRTRRTRQLLNLVSKRVVKNAKDKRQVIVSEDIAGIRRLYRKGNSQRRSYRAKMNSWPLHEVKRQIEYKAAREGVPVITLTKGETRGPRWIVHDAGRDSKCQSEAM